MLLACLHPSIASVLIGTNVSYLHRICETDFFNVLLDLFKQYCWNNILHSQVKKCFSYAFSAFVHGEDNICTPSALQTHVGVALSAGITFNPMIDEHFDFYRF